MKSLKSFLLPGAVALLAAGALTACQNNFDQPPLNPPVAKQVPNTTIAELKAQNWQEDYNYYTTLGKNAEGQDIIIHGRVISSDATGNIYKKLVIQDETAALSFSLNQTAINNTYRVGQEVVINVTDLGMGKYAGLQQIGGYGEYNGTPQVSFMDFSIFQAHTELNGFPEPADYLVQESSQWPSDKMYIVEADIASLPTTPEGIRRMQSQLVEFKNVSFEGGGTLPFSEADNSTSRTLKGQNGGSLVVRNSNYASFRAEILPEGVGTVRGILSYFNGTWQLELRSAQDCIFSAKGQASDPYSVGEAIEMQDQGTSGWVEGYIVGSVKANVGDIDSNEKIIWGADAEMDNTLVIAPTADTKDYKQCLVLTLPQGSSLRQNGNLLDNPSNYGKKISVTGAFENYLGTSGIINNSGAVTEYKIDGLTPGPVSGETVTSIDETFDASTNIPAGWTTVQVKGNKNWYIPTFNGNNYAAMTGYKGTAPFESWLITPAINASGLAEKVMSFTTQVNGYGATTTEFEVYVMTTDNPETAQLTKLNPTLATAPASGYSDWVNSGSLSLAEFSGTIYIGFVYKATTDANYATWCVDNVLVGKTASDPVNPPVNPPTPGGQGTEDNPFTCADIMASTADATGVWAEGYVVGYISGKTYASGATFSADFTGVSTDDYNNTNCILADTPTAASATDAIPAGIKAGDTRDVLGLRNNPSILGKKVKVYGDVTKYFGTRGIKNISRVVEL